MNYAELVPALQSSDTFHKNLLLLFDDLVALVKEKAYSKTLQDLVGPENGYWISSSRTSEHRKVWVFSLDNRIHFVEMLIATNDDHLRGNSGNFKALCSQLGRDPKFPLLLIYGVFEPGDSEKFNNDLNLRRQWVLNATLINTDPCHVISNFAELQFGKTYTVESKEGSNPWFCENAIVKVIDLMTLDDSTKLASVADDLLEM